MPAHPNFKVKRLTQPGTLSDRVSEALVQLIQGKDFPAGSRLPTEMDMAKRFGVSRTVIREAISRLKSEGLVESRQGSGVYVLEGDLHPPFRIDPSIMESLPSVLQVVELRLVLESEIAAFAAKRRSREQMKAIRQALQQIETDVRAGKDGVDADLAFHRCIAEASGNPHFLGLVEFLANYLKNAVKIARGYEATDTTLALQASAEHDDIVEAIASKDAEAARAAARRHMEGAARRISRFAAGRLSKH